MLKIFRQGVRELNSDVETWVVRWNSRYGSFSGDNKEQVQVFTDFEEAKAFKAELERANKLLKHTASDITNFKIEKMSNGL